MFTQPPNLTDDAVAEVLDEGWGLTVDSIAYAAVGFGSHHWNVVADQTRWFITVDDLDTRLRHPGDTRMNARQRLICALSTAQSLEHQGYSFVVAPIASRGGSPLESVNDKYVLSVYPHIQGRTGAYGRYTTRAERLTVVDRLIELHEATAACGASARTDDLGIPKRGQLDTALGETYMPWSTGPYSERARSLLDRYATDLSAVLNRYDDLVALVQNRGGDLVLTHGEPHRGNVIFTAEGASLVDWDTTLLAHRERDLWALIDEDPEVAAYYEAKSGHPLNDDVLQLYRLWWDLCEVSLFVADFRSTHIESADTRTAWIGLQKHLDPRRWAERS